MLLLWRAFPLLLLLPPLLCSLLDQLTVTSSLYARYYFELRTVADSDESRAVSTSARTPSRALRVETRSKAKAAQEAANSKFTSKPLKPIKGSKFKSRVVEDGEFDLDARWILM